MFEASTFGSTVAVTGTVSGATPTADGHLTTKLYVDGADATIQSDVDQNESDADAAIAVVQNDVNQNESDADAADAALSGRITTLEADPTTATAVTD